MDFNISPPHIGDHNLPHGFLAALIIACTITDAHLGAHKLSQPIATLWQGRNAQGGELMAPRICAIIRPLLGLP